MNMRYIKKFESYIAEGQDMMFVPVDVVKGTAELLSDIGEAVFAKAKHKIESNLEAIERQVPLSESMQERIASALEEALGKSRFEMRYEDITLASAIKAAAAIGSELLDALKQKMSSVWDRIWGSAVVESSSVGVGLLILAIVVFIMFSNIKKSIARAKEIQLGGWEESRSGGRYYYTKDGVTISSKYKVKTVDDVEYEIELKRRSEEYEREKAAQEERESERYMKALRDITKR